MIYNRLFKIINVVSVKTANKPLFISGFFAQNLTARKKKARREAGKR